MSPVKLAIAIPSAGMWHASFGMSLTQMCLYMASTLFNDGQERAAVLLDKRTSMLPRSRQESVEDAINQECTHILFLDTDQTFPHDTAHQMLRWGKPVVACNIPLKTIPSFPTARARGASPFGVPVTSEPWRRGLEKVWRVGTGVMLLDLKVFKSIPKPWFGCYQDPATQQFVGEDWFLCHQLEKAGVDIHIDHDLSRQVGHIGFFVYTHANIPVAEEAQAA